MPGSRDEWDRRRVLQFHLCHETSVDVHHFPVLRDAVLEQRGHWNMMQMTDMPVWMMWGMGLVWLLLIIFLVLGIAAFVKYLRS